MCRKSHVIAEVITYIQSQRREALHVVGYMCVTSFLKYVKPLVEEGLRGDKCFNSYFMLIGVDVYVIFRILLLINIYM